MGHIVKSLKGVFILSAVYDLSFLGTVILLLYIIFDFIRNQTKNLVRRIFFYSFIFYLLIVVNLTIGSIVIHPFNDTDLTIQLIPFYFIKELFNMYQVNGLSWFFWNSLKLSFFNFIMLMPLGFYLSGLFKINSQLKALLVIFFVSFSIEIIQLTFTYLGLIMPRSFDFDDLIMNTLGGYVAFLLYDFTKKHVKMLGL